MKNTQLVTVRPVSTGQREHKKSYDGQAWELFSRRIHRTLPGS